VRGEGEYPKLHRRTKMDEFPCNATIAGEKNNEPNTAVLKVRIQHKCQQHNIPAHAKERIPRRPQRPCSVLYKLSLLGGRAKQVSRRR